MPRGTGLRRSTIRELAAGINPKNSSLPTISSVPLALARGKTGCAIGRPSLLLARLGLRASEVANLKAYRYRLQNGRLAVAGKSRREEWLPLTQEVGDAIITYVEQARPRLPTSRLFLTDLAPVRPLTRIAVKCIVRRTLRRAGIKSDHQGAHVLRHSAATAMLRQGVEFDRCRNGSASPITGNDHALCQGRLRPFIRDCAALGREAAMLIDDVERYIALRRSLGFQLRKPSHHLQAFARIAAEKGETHIRAAAVVAWAAAGPTRDARHRRLNDVARFAHSCAPRTPRTRCRRPGSSPRPDRDLLRIFTHQMNWPASLKPPDGSAC